MKTLPFAIIMILIAAVLGLSLVPENPLYNVNWPVFSAGIICLAIGAAFWRFEKKGITSKEIALIATLASLAAVSRVPFAVIMSLQPTTFVVMIAGYVFGSQTGFVIGAVAALVSNFFLGQGPWTPWQMFCWGMCGVIAGSIAGREEKFNRLTFAALAGLCGYLFGWVMNIWHWVGFVYPLNMETFAATYAASLPFDTIHAVGNVAFALLLGPAFYRILLRYKKKMRVTYMEDPPSAGTDLA